MRLSMNLSKRDEEWRHVPDHVLKSPFHFLCPVMVEGELGRARSGSNTTHANNSLPEYDSFLIEVEPDQGGFTGIVIYDNNPLLELPSF
ncbi:hypothetical protein Tco_0735224 [Tanacetum coccineum]